MGDNSTNKRLNFCNFKLDTLLDVTLSINENLSVDELLLKFKNILLEKLNIGNLIVYAHNKGWGKILESGFGEQGYKEIDVEKDLLPITEITTTTAAGLEHLDGIDTIIPVFHNNRAVAFVLFGDSEESEGVSPTIKHLLFIQTLTNIIIVAIENRRLAVESLRQEALRKELELASRMQAMLIPNSSVFPKTEKIFVAAHYLPHFDVGGDYYDCLKLSNSEYGFCIADVSGKGISAAFLMSNFQANLRALFTSQIPLEDLVQTLNSRVLSSANGEKFITLFIGRYNTESKTLTYINAGHNPPILYNKISGEVVNLTKGCPGMGMLDEIPVIKTGEVEIKDNTKMLCYTDGLVELRGEDTTDAGMAALIDVFKNALRIDQTIEFMINELHVSKENRMFFDDISILGIEFEMN